MQLRYIFVLQFEAPSNLIIVYFRKEKEEDRTDSDTYFIINEKEMTEYWLISAPGDKTCQQTWETMNNLTNKQNNLSTNYKFHIPDLKVRKNLSVKNII